SLSNPALANNLPVQLSSFVGRAEELGVIRQLLGGSRLVTLTGAGGSGKTRLALQVAAELLDGSGDGVWFVELAPVADASLVAGTVATAVGIPLEAGCSALEALVSGLADRSLLLVLDNCEHLIDSCAKVAETVIRSCPHVVLL